MIRSPKCFPKPPPVEGPSSAASTTWSALWTKPRPERGPTSCLGLYHPHADQDCLQSGGFNRCAKAGPLNKVAVGCPAATGSRPAT